MTKTTESNGRTREWLKLAMTLAIALTAAAIAFATVRTNVKTNTRTIEKVEAKADANDSNIMDHDGDGIPERMVKFDRAAVEAILSPADEFVITVTGQIAGAAFEGTDIIRVIEEGNNQEKTNNGKGKK